MRGATSRGADRLAIDIYNHAQATRQPITLAMVKARMNELRGHPTTCTCGLCTAAARCAPTSVYDIARQWQRGLAIQRRIGAR